MTWAHIIGGAMLGWLAMRGAEDEGEAIFLIAVATAGAYLLRL